MYILVNATANDSRGPFSITDSFIKEMVDSSEYLKLKRVNLTILVSRKELCKYKSDQVTVKYVIFPKKSVFHKFFFENKVLPKMMENCKYDVYLSLQNLVLNINNFKQYVLIHTPLPFADLKPRELETKNYIKYKIILKYLLKKYRTKATGIIVQTGWMREAVKTTLNYKGEIRVIRPEVKDISLKNKQLDFTVSKAVKNNDIKLFCPINKEYYKNSKRVIEAVRKYNKINPIKVKLYITLEGKSDDNIIFLGRVNYESIFSLYSNMNALIFPSLAETLGLPLIEAEQSGIQRIVPDLPYAKEICGDKAYYFNPRKVDSMVKVITEYVNTNRSEVSIVKKIGNSGEKPRESYIDYIDFILDNN